VDGSSGWVWAISYLKQMLAKGGGDKKYSLLEQMMKALMYETDQPVAWW